MQHCFISLGILTTFVDVHNGPLTKTDSNVDKNDRWTATAQENKNILQLTFQNLSIEDCREVIREKCQQNSNPRQPWRQTCPVCSDQTWF